MMQKEHSQFTCLKKFHINYRKNKLKSFKMNDKQNEQ